MNTPTDDFLQNLTNEAIIPNCEEIAGIAADGDIAVVVHKPSPGVLSAVRAMGGGEGDDTRVFRLSRSRAKRLLGKADHVTAAWVGRQEREAQILAVTGDGTLLINVRDGAYSLEPDSYGRSSAHLN